MQKAPRVIMHKPRLTSYQKDFLYNGSRFTVTEASTKVGKTFSHLWWIFERAHEDWNKAGYEHWWVAPIYQQSRIAFKRLKRKVANNPFYHINSSSMTVICPNGSLIIFKSADKPDSLYGEDVHSIVFDEAPRAKQDAFFALRSTITATRGMMKLIGNFGGNSNWVHQLKKKASTDKNYAYFKVNAWDGVKAGILDEEEILQAQKDLPPKIFSQLYLAEEQGGENMLCDYDAINDLWTNPKDESNKNRYITSDIAFLGSDLFTIYVWEGFEIIDYYETDKSEPEEVERLLKQYADKYRVGRSRIAYDSDGLGGFLKSYLKGARPFVNNGKVVKIGRHTPNYKNLKSQCGYEFAKRINSRQISISTENIPVSKLKQEVECLQSFGLDTDGKIQLLPKKKVKEIIGRSPDRLDGLIMREVFELKPNTRTRITV